MKVLNTLLIPFPSLERHRGSGYSSRYQFFSSFDCQKKQSRGAQEKQKGKQHNSAKEKLLLSSPKETKQYVQEKRRRSNTTGIRDVKRAVGVSEARAPEHVMHTEQYYLNTTPPHHHHHHHPIPYPQASPGDTAPIGWKRRATVSSTLFP